MRRTVEPDYEFNKESFAEVLGRAMGEKSYSEFGRLADISFGYISKYMNLKCDVSPTLPTIKKIAKVSTTVKYAELLEASGYDPDKYDDVEFLREMGNEAIGWTPANTILPALCNVNFKWKFQNTDVSTGAPFAVELEDAPFDMWYFIPVRKDFVTKDDIMSVLASKEAEVINPQSKVTFMTSSEESYKRISEMELNLISLKISVLLIDADIGVVIKEEYIKSAVKIENADRLFMITNINGISSDSLFV